MIIEKTDSSPVSAKSMEPVINNFSITVASVNGSGSQTSNLTMMRALFKMGIPVSGKNIFPSNIQGLPTWYTIRINEEGHLARCEDQEIVVAMNPATFIKDMEGVVEGGVLFYDDSIKFPISRQDIHLYPMPVKQMVRDSGAPANIRDYIANMVYVGIVANILKIDMDRIYQALEYHFKGKQKPIDLNWGMVKNASDWADKNLQKTDAYSVRPSNKTDGFIMADGNTAAALGALYGGLQFAAWYPITPATSLAETLNEYIPVFRKDPVTGKNTCVVIQAEDELAAIGMVVGAGFSGLRAMTSTSGPGLSLMVEYVGLAYFSEVPVVIWDIQRIGPSTGLPTRTSQGDLRLAYFMGHGDVRHVILFPGSVTECFEFGWKAFDIAERLQTPVIVLSDLDFGMNQWMTTPFEYPDKPMDRGKVLWEEDLKKVNGKWGRYVDVDGDGITYRTLPGNKYPNAAYFARGTGHDENANYSEQPDDWENNLLRLQRKIDGSITLLPKPVIKSTSGAKISIISYGSTDIAIDEALVTLSGQGYKIDHLRIRALPTAPEVMEFVRAHERNYVIELNRDGQLHQILRLEIPDCTMKLISLSHLDGLPLTAQWVISQLIAKEEGQK
ncbi:MAG: ferredoxin oxidoreductase [Chloroflexi bacterium RBG_16_47_49]|nr:MAG: ferredoxin oxidoreductase [Chloroflexi bacterium RBG_16_47_49]